MPNEAKILNIIAEALCPHCSNAIMVSQKMMAPQVAWVLKKDDLDKAKAKVRAEVEKFKFKDEQSRKNILGWLEMEETVFGPDEVATVLQQVLNDK